MSMCCANFKYCCNMLISHCFFRVFTKKVCCSYGSIPKRW